MTQKELQKLGKAQLLKMMLEQTKKANKLAEENSRLKERITDREHQLAQVGALAEMALRLSDTPGKADTIKHIMEVRDLVADVERSVQADKEAGSEEEEDEEEDDDSDYPTVEQMERELLHERYRRTYAWTFRSTVYALITVAAAAVLVAVLFMPVLQIYGSSMNPTLWEGDYVVSVKNSSMKTGDLCAFYYNNRILVKRVIGQPGQWIDIAEDGTVFVDNVRIDEPYLTEKAFGECDIELPYQVPESRIFVMGDNRSVSVDSRSSSVGCVADEQMVGKIIFCVWPFSHFGNVA